MRTTSRRYFVPPVLLQVIANIVIVILMGIGLSIVYIEISHNVVSQDIRNAFTGVFLAVTLFLLAERISDLISVIAEHNKSEQDRRETDTMYMNIQGLSRQLLQSIGNTRGITRLGHISAGLGSLTSTVEKSVVVRDVTFRTDSVDVDQYGDGIRQYVNAVWSNINSIESYELILCRQSETYPKIFLGAHAKTPEDLPKKFHLKEIDVSIPYPNFTIFYDRDGRKSLILGWPFSTGTAGDLFLIEEQGLIGVFERLFSSLWELQTTSTVQKAML